MKVSLIVAAGMVFALPAVDVDSLAFPDAASVAAKVEALGSTAKARFLAPGTIELPATFSSNRSARAHWRFKVPLDMRRAKGIEFELYSEDFSQFSGFSIYFSTAKGCYTGTYSPREEGSWHKVTVLKSDCPRDENDVAGWGRVKSFTIAGWRGGTDDTFLRVRNFRLIGCEPDVLVVRGDHSWKTRTQHLDDYPTDSAVMLDFLTSLGANATEMSDLEIDADALSGIRLAVLPWNPRLPPQTAAALRDFAGRGGKLLCCYSIPEGLDKTLGIKGSFYAAWMHPEFPAFEGVLRSGKGLEGQPEFAPRASRCAYWAKFTGQGEVLATWTGKDRRPLEIPALLKTQTGYFFAHTWTGTSVAARALWRSVLLDVHPGWRDAMDAAERKTVSAERAEAEWVAAQKPRAGERRAFSCHSEAGPYGYTWDETIRILKDGGFNCMSPNIAWATGIFRKEAEECLAACRKYGVECMFWKICWRPHRSFKGKLPGRTQVAYDGKPLSRWLCPADPANVKSEVEMCMELARMKPDILSLDYVRYPDRNGCFCDGCRAAFEGRYGKVADWPRDLRRRPELAKSWTEFRCSNITAFLREVSRRVRAECPDVKIKASVFSQTETTPDDIGQEWVNWCKEGLLDYASPMNYYSGPSVMAFTSLLKQQMRAVKGSKVELLPSIGLSVWPDRGHDAKMLCERINAVREVGLGGFGVFELRDRAIKLLPVLRAGITSE